MRLPGLLAVGLFALTAPWSSSQIILGSAAIARAPQTCGGDSYVNIDGKCVHRPVRADRAPTGATAKCRDGTYSFSQNHRGTCSYHGGVAAWL
jgi:hypothetical protein